MVQNTRELEAAAIDQAYSNEIANLFAMLADNIVNGQSLTADNPHTFAAAEDKFANGLKIMRLARAAAMDLIKND